MFAFVKLICFVFLFSSKKVFNQFLMWEMFSCSKFYCSSFFIFTLTSPPLPLFLSAPCPLMTFLPTVNCATGVVSVTWDNSVPGVVHTVSAVDTTGRRHNCSSTNGSCNLSTLECGTEYNVTITPSRNGCVGRDSPTKMITTGKDQ